MREPKSGYRRHRQGGETDQQVDANGALRWNEDDVSRLVQAALELAEARLPTKAGVSR